MLSAPSETTKMLRQPLLAGKDNDSLDASSDVQDDVKIREVRLSFNTTEALLSEFPARYGVRAIPNQDENLNMHPFIAYERNTLQAVMMRHLDDLTIIDVGGSPKRLAKYNRHHTHLYFLCPQLQPGDFARARAGDASTMCHHTLEESLEISKNPPHVYTGNKASMLGEERFSCCGGGTCHVCRVPDIYIFTHSAYYMKPEVLVQALNNCGERKLLVIGHLFDRSHRTHYVYGNAETHQARYSWLNADILTYQASGNKHTYNHRPLPWNDSNTFCVNGRIYEAIVIRKMGETYLWEIVETLYPTVPLDVTVLDWRRMLVDPDQRGLIQTTMDSRLITPYTIEHCSIDLKRFIGVGPMLVCFSENRQIFIPRGAISAVATSMVGKERNTATFQLAVTVARGYINSSIIAIEEKPAAITAAAVIGFSLNLDFETNMLDTARYQFSGWWNRHTQSLKLTAITVIPISVIVLVLVLFDSGTVILDEQFDPSEHYALIGGVIVTVLLSLLLCLRWYMERRSVQDLAASFGDVRRVDGRGLDIVDSLPLKSLKVPAGYNFNSLVDIEEGNEIMVGPDPKPETIRRDTLFATGIIPSNASVFTAPNSQAAEVAALTNRVLAPNPYEMEFDGLQIYQDVFQYHSAFTALNGMHINDNEDAFRTWISRTPYDQTERERLCKVRSEVLDGTRKIKGSLKVHVKNDEKLIKVDLRGEKPYTPRAISAASDEHKVITGPFMWEFSNQLAKIWNSNFIVYYVRGSSAEDVGAWMGRYINNICGGDYSKIFVIEGDAVKFDKSVLAEHKAPIRALWSRIGASQLTIAAYTNEVTAGVTRHNVRFKSKSDQIGSGRNDTNVMGSMVNAGVTIGAIEPVLHETRNDQLGVNGDDNLVLRDPKLYDSSNSEECMKNYRSLGIDIAMHFRTHLAHVEFCSKIFLQSARHTGVWVLSPKPGRAIVKLGWCKTHSGNTLGTDVLSLAKDGMHVPFLRHVISRTRALAPPVRKSKPVRSWEWEIHAKEYHDNKDGKLPQSTWDIVWERYGLTEDDEREFAELVAKVATLPTAINSPALQRILDKDLDLLE